MFLRFFLSFFLPSLFILPLLIRPLCIEPDSHNTPNSQPRPLRPEVAHRLVAGDGDVSVPHRCGLSKEGLAALRSSRKLVFVHSAASIYFTDHVHDLISMNYGATRNVLQLADEVCGKAAEAKKDDSTSFSSSSSATPTLSAFIHVSTAYVNANRPAGTRVKEMVYSLVDEGNRLDRRTRKRLGLGAGEEERGAPSSPPSPSSSSSSSSSASKSAAAAPLVVDHGALMRSLLAIEDRGAAARVAQKVVDALGFPNAYTLTKNCCEKLVADWHEGRAPAASPSAPKKNETSSALAGKLVIVRPTIIGPIGDGEHRGYFGNGAGITSLVLAFATGVRCVAIVFRFVFLRGRGRRNFKKKIKNALFFFSHLFPFLDLRNPHKTRSGGRSRRLEPHVPL